MTFGNPWSPLFGAANACGGLLRLVGIDWAPLDAAALLARARKATGLHELATEGMPAGELEEGLRRFLRAADAEAELTPLGRLATHQDVLRLLTNRLRLVGDRQRYPGIAAESIEAPVFITGLPRCGTTLLHGLLDADPAVRTPLTWEVMYPSPPPGADDDATRARRIATVRRQLRWFERLVPDYKVAHPVGAEWPQECMEILTQSFQSDRFPRTHQVPSYNEWLDRTPAGAAYAFHRAFLQHLQWRSPARRWVLKNPPHIFALEALHRVYPDARFIQLHREPITVMASFVSHTRRLRAAFTRHPEHLGTEATIRRWADGLERLVDFRAAGAAPADHWVDIAYEDLVHEPLRMVEHIYDRLGWPLEAATRERMARFLRAHPQHQFGVHQYHPADFGIDPERHGVLFERYCREFEVPLDYPR